MAAAGRLSPDISLHSPAIPTLLLKTTLDDGARDLGFAFKCELKCLTFAYIVLNISDWTS